MLKLKGYLKPFIVSFLMAFVLLFGQAMCDLYLPKLMSDIVNVGIQQGGVEERTPRALSEDGFEFVGLFMSAEDKKLFEKSYTPVKASDTDASGKSYQSLYPAAKNGSLYVLDADITPENRTALDETFGVTAWTMLNVFKQLADETDEADEVEASGTASTLGNTTASASAAQAGDTQETSIAETGLTDLDISEIYKLTPKLKLMAEFKPEVFQDARTQARATDKLMRKQTATALTGAFYSDLGMNMSDFEIGYIVRVGALMLLITFVGGAASVFVGFLSSRIGAGLARDLRRDIFAKVSSFSHAEFDRFSTASLITRSTNDVTQIQTLLTMGIRMICYAPILAIGATIMAVQKSVSMSWIIGIAVLFLMCMVVVLMIIVMPKFKIIQKLIDRLNLVARETLNGLMVIRAFGRSGFERERFEVANLDVTKTNLFIQRAMVFMMPLMMVFMNGLTVLIIWVGAHQVAASAMQVGDMMAYMQYAMQVVMGFMFIAMAFIFVPRAAVSAGRIAEVLETEPVIRDPKKPLSMDEKQLGRVEFKSVDFRFEGAEHDALTDISFVAEPGSTTAFIGSTGSGKSTILNLVMRFYDATAGEVLVGGVDVRNLTQQELRSHLGYVPQKSVLLTGTIAQNITFGNHDLSQENLEKLADVAQATEFIDSREERFDFDIAQGGTNVSGGQRQRISIARALAVNPSIFLFDDSFSALDFKTDAALRSALHAHTKDSTLLIVAQRVSTIMDADMIYVVDDGMIVGRGKHNELLKTCPAYYEIASSQLNEEELHHA
ncbi:MAG: ABC transporter ATP-binding protein/permease [Coriobacteriia bacterium]|nr:ABC transporter ATP-binding protein/permease [Coriobacteriia bacterium]